LELYVMVAEKAQIGEREGEERGRVRR